MKHWTEKDRCRQVKEIISDNSDSDVTWLLSRSEKVHIWNPNTPLKVKKTPIIIIQIN